MRCLGLKIIPQEVRLATPQKTYLWSCVFNVFCATYCNLPGDMDLNFESCCLSSSCCVCVCGNTEKNILPRHNVKKTHDQGGLRATRNKQSHWFSNFRRSLGSFSSHQTSKPCSFEPPCWWFCKNQLIRPWNAPFLWSSWVRDVCGGICRSAALPPSCGLCICLYFIRRRLLLRRESRKQACLDEFDDEMWNEADDTVERFIPILRQHGLSQSQVLDQAQEIRKRQSSSAGVSLQYLLSSHFEELATSRTGLENPTFHDMKTGFWCGEDALGRDIVCPRDGKLGCALVDWIPRVYRRQQTHHLSWSWKYTLGEIRSAMRLFMQNQSSGQHTAVFFFMCFFVNNQYRILVESHHYDACNDLQELFKQRLRRMGRMVILLDDWKFPVYLSRIWSVYEVYVALDLDVQITIAMPEHVLESFRIVIQQGEPGMQYISKTLVEMDLEKATASTREAEAYVKSEIEHAVGFGAVNRYMKQAMQQWMGTVFQSSDWEGIAEKAADMEVEHLLEMLEQELWHVQGDTVQKYSRLLGQLGMSAEEVLQHVQRIQARQSPEAGVSLRYLLSNEFADLARARTGLENPTFIDMKKPFWLLEDPTPIGIDILCPRDGKLGCALVDWIPPEHRRQQTHFMSWTWKYTMGQLRSALEMFMMNAVPARDPSVIFFYVCFFVNNQFRILVDGAAGSDALENSFQQSLTRIGRMVAVLDTWEQPVYLTRVWTVYEQFVACSLKCPVEFVMPSNSMASLHSQIRQGDIGLKKVRDSICNFELLSCHVFFFCSMSIVFR